MDFVLAPPHRPAVATGGQKPSRRAEELGGGGDLGTQRSGAAAADTSLVDPEQEYTLDQVWEVAKDVPFVRQNGITKEQLGQFLGAGAATKVDPGDQSYLDKAAEAYKERLKKAGLSADRPAAQYAKGGLTPWLYYQYGAMALELDVWGVPKAEKAEKKAEAGANAADTALTLDQAAAMTSDDFVALGEEKITAFLKENKVPAQFNAQMVIGR